MSFRPLVQFCGLALSMVAVSAVDAENSATAVVEVFTSEGCSSCPPAEEMLSRLDREFGHSDAVISLEWHVDYWDYLGWKDRFGSSEATKRQYRYADALASQVYTPQAIVNGTLVPQYAGDLVEVKTLVRQALGRPSGARIDLAVAQTADPEVVRLKVVSQGETKDARVLALLVEDGLSSKPTAGENAGRELKHTHVVRRSQLFDTTGDFSFAVGHEIDRSNASIVVLLQDQKTFRILAAKSAPLSGRVSISQKSRWKGRIVDRSGKPKAQVYLQACSEKLCVPGSTDENGFFMFPSLPAGHYSLTVGKSPDVVEVTLSGSKGGTVTTPVVVP